jgi:hypothetical protein
MRRQAFIARQSELRYYRPQRKILSTMTAAGSAQTMATLSVERVTVHHDGDRRRTRQAVPDRPRQRTGGPRAAICLATGGWPRAARAGSPAGGFFRLAGVGKRFPAAFLWLWRGSEWRTNPVPSDDLGTLATGGC